MRSWLIPALLLLAAGCASNSPRGLVRVDLAGPATGPGSAQELQLTQAVRDAADSEGLVCQPGAAAELLRCTAATLGSQSRGITIDLSRSGTGYEVSIGQPVRLGSSPVCAVQDRVRDRIDAELKAPVARVDTRSDCKRK